MPSNITRFLAFQRDQAGILPPKMAADYLGITRQALNQALAKKKVEAIRHAGRAYFGMNSLRFFKDWRTAKRLFEKEFKDGVTP